MSELQSALLLKKQLTGKYDRQLARPYFMCRAYKNNKLHVVLVLYSWTFYFLYKL